MKQKSEAAMASESGNWGCLFTRVVAFLLVFSLSQGQGGGLTKEEAEETPVTNPNPNPTPKAWPPQFHSVLVMNYSGELQIIDLWYDWPNGRNFNIIRKQLTKQLLYDLEWNNGTSFFYTLDGGVDGDYCRSVQMEVGILRPNWLDGASYLGQQHVDGFLCNVWQKADFIWYYEDVNTKTPVHWRFYTGREAHVMTFEVGAALEDSKWQAPLYCFESKEDGDDDDAKIPLSPLQSSKLGMGRSISSLDGLWKAF